MMYSVPVSTQLSRFEFILILLFAQTKVHSIPLLDVVSYFLENNIFPPSQLYSSFERKMLNFSKSPTAWKETLI